MILILVYFVSFVVFVLSFSVLFLSIFTSVSKHLSILLGLHVHFVCSIVMDVVDSFFVLNNIGKWKNYLYAMQLKSCHFCVESKT